MASLAARQASAMAKVVFCHHCQGGLRVRPTGGFALRGSSLCLSQKRALKRTIGGWLLADAGGRFTDSRTRLGLVLKSTKSGTGGTSTSGFCARCAFWSGC